jgi:sulfane dehydrogenase subunit SoxC
MRKKKRPALSEPEQAAAGNGLLDRRLFLAGGAAVMGSAALSDTARTAEAAPAEPLLVEPWMKTPGSPFTPYGQPSRYTNKVARVFAGAPGTTGTGASRTPLHRTDFISSATTTAFPTSILMHTGC